jgi:hypothetical protein
MPWNLRIASNLVLVFISTEDSRRLRNMQRSLLLFVAREEIIELLSKQKLILYGLMALLLSRMKDGKMPCKSFFMQERSMNKSERLEIKKTETFVNIVLKNSIQASLIVTTTSPNTEDRTPSRTFMLSLI